MPGDVETYLLSHVTSSFRLGLRTNMMSLLTVMSASCLVMRMLAALVLRKPWAGSHCLHIPG